MLSFDLNISHSSLSDVILQQGRRMFLSRPLQIAQCGRQCFKNQSKSSRALGPNFLAPKVAQLAIFAQCGNPVHIYSNRCHLRV